MPPLPDANTIRILVATDNHVGYEERDPIRKDDSWKTFDEIIRTAKEEDVDMILLAGDLFHDNKPSRKSMYQVMRSLRKHCLGMKPIELEFLSDANLVFEGAFPNVNYEDPDINIAIPVFSIHGLVNYYGRINEGDNIETRPVLLQKGTTKLALYGLSNVRDERMFRTFRDGKVKWFRPGVQTGDWFNLLSVHQNHHAHTATSYLPEGVLPDWMDLVVWGHEHECLIDPTRNPETGFHVMQPGSSVATSLVPGEAVRKHVAVLSVTGKDFRVRKIPLKTVRPFVTREIILAQHQKFTGLDRKKDNRQEVTKHLMDIVEEMIVEANNDWMSIQDGQPETIPLPLIRLKVEYTAPEGGKFDCENPQRFSNRFVGKVANTNDVVYFYRKKTITSRKTDAADVPETLENLTAEGVKVENLVQEFLAAQSLKILPQAPFGDAVNQFVTKDDKYAMESFVSESLAGQVKQMLDLDPTDDNLDEAMVEYKKRVETQFAAGSLQQNTRRMVKPRPEDWDSDMDGHWDDQPGVWVTDNKAPPPALTSRRTAAASRRGTAIDDEDDDDPFSSAAMPAAAPPKRAPAKRGTAAAAATTARTTSRTARATPSAAAPKKTTTKTSGRGAGGGRGGKKSNPFVDDESEDEDQDSDVVMQSDEDEAPPAARTTAPATRRQPARNPNPATTTAGRRGARGGGGAVGAASARQTTLDFSQPSQRLTRQAPASSKYAAVEISDDEISDDDDDAFETPPVSLKSSRKR